MLVDKLSQNSDLQHIQKSIASMVISLHKASIIREIQANASTIQKKLSASVQKLCELKMHDMI